MSEHGEAVMEVQAAGSVERLEQLQAMLDRNRDAYYRAIDAGRGLSRRMYGWLDEYDKARGTAVWAAFCKKHGLAPSHRALDIMA
jgi:hypothetical protein